MDIYVDIAIKCAYILVSLIAFVVMLIQTNKNKNEAKKQAILNATEQEIQNTALELIQKAEEFKNYSGEEKLNFVLTRMKALNQTLYGETELTALINKLVAMSKNVNSEKKS